MLASEAGIAIENARLFAEEQRKSRQLTLINNVSSHAITTLDPDEMLAKIAAEMEKRLPYDHIGIAILDYSAKELVVHAEAGTRREALGRRIPLGEGLVGQVARSGQMATVYEVSSATPPHRAAGLRRLAIALPVTYAEQLLGVLYVESAETCRFPRGRSAAASHARRSLCRRVAQRAHVPEGAGAGHHRRPHRREDAPLPDGSALGGMEALDARQPPVRAGADGPRPLQIRQRFLRPPRRRRGPAARGTHSRAELPPVRRGRALRRRRIRDSHAGNRRRAGAPAGRQAPRLDRLRSAAARQKHHRELRHRRRSRFTARRRRSSFRSPTPRCTSRSIRAATPFRAPSREIPTIASGGRRTFSKRISASR